MNERVVLLRRVGEGATGVVYRAFDLLDLRLVAVKVIPVNNQQKRRQLVHEISSLYDRLRTQRRRECCRKNAESRSPLPRSPPAATATSSPTNLQDGSEHILELIDVFVTKSNSTLSLVVEYMDGGSLQDLVDKGGCQDEGTLAHMSLQTLRGLAFVHACKLIHRDIKPANVLLNTKGELKIADFGLARTLAGTGEAAVKSLHRAHTFVGTVTYMSPERINGDSYSFSSDVWSMGMMLLTTALGKLPLETKNGYWGVLHSIRDADAPTLPKDGSWSPEFREFIALCLEKDPARRPDCSTLMETAFIRR
ncbi:unnamed protein product, partial [Laminaria digitata]